MRYKSHFLSSRRFNYAFRSTTGGGHSIYIVDYIVNKDSLYNAAYAYDSTNGDYIIKFEFDSYTPYIIKDSYESATGDYVINYEYDSGSLYQVKHARDYNR